MVLDEAERSLHDALRVVRCLAFKRFLIASGRAPEIKLLRQLRAWVRSLQGMEGYYVKHIAESLEVISYTFNPMSSVTELRNKHARREINAGINVRKEQINDILDENVV